MPTHSEWRHLDHTPQQLFDLVTDIEKYPEFLPWCVAARIRKRDDDVILADLVIGYKMFRERFTSQVSLSGPGLIDVAYSEGPFKYLNNHWIFEEGVDGGCDIDFFVEFELRSRLLEKIIGVVFNEAIQRMVSAFERRADDLYGPGEQST
jgi:coenzyme Q-binding protein COQ10